MYFKQSVENLRSPLFRSTKWNIKFYTVELPAQYSTVIFIINLIRFIKLIKFFLGTIINLGKSIYVGGRERHLKPRKWNFAKSALHFALDGSLRRLSVDISHRDLLRDKYKK